MAQCLVTCAGGLLSQRGLRLWGGVHVSQYCGTDCKSKCIMHVTSLLEFLWVSPACPTLAAGWVGSNWPRPWGFTFSVKSISVKSMRVDNPLLGHHMHIYLYHAITASCPLHSTMRNNNLASACVPSVECTMCKSVMPQREQHHQQHTPTTASSTQVHSHLWCAICACMTNAQWRHSASHMLLLYELCVKSCHVRFPPISNHNHTVCKHWARTAHTALPAP